MVFCNSPDASALLFRSISSIISSCECFKILRYSGSTSTTWFAIVNDHEGSFVFRKRDMSDMDFLKTLDGTIFCTLNMTILCTKTIKMSIEKHKRVYSRIHMQYCLIFQAY